MPELTPLIIDVDTGIDDSLALLLACASPEADLRAVTCVSGNVEAGQVATNTLAVLELAGRSDVEVALGRRVPLLRQPRTAPETHGPRGLGYAELPPPNRAVSPRHAVDVILGEARRARGQLTLLTLGPLTNLALAVLREPELPLQLRRLVMMAGSYRSPGNTAPTTEWNVAVDPEAFQIVLDAWAAVPGVPRPLALGLDVTERAKLVPAHLDRLREAAGHGRRSAVVRFIEDALRFYMEFHSRYDGFYGAFIHDALALAAALDVRLVRTEALAVQVERGGTLTTGETVTDWRRTWGRQPNLDVAVEADVELFFDLLIERVGRLSAGAPDVAS